MEDRKALHASCVRPKEEIKTEMHSRRRRRTSAPSTDSKIPKSHGGHRSHRSQHQRRHSSSKSAIWTMPGDGYQPSLEEKILRDRNWHYTDLGHGFNGHKAVGLGFVSFTVASYNLLSQDLLEANLYLYEGVKKEYLDWNYRGRNLMNEIKFRRPDILCLQEMHCKHYHQFEKELRKKNYTGVYHKRTGQDKQDGCAIFYKEDKFELRHTACVDYYKHNVPALDRDNVAIVLLLGVKGSHQLLCVATTHILFNPRRGDVKLAQLMVLLSEIDRLAHKGFEPITCEPLYHPVILCGDFNLVPFCPLYKFVCRGHLQYEGLPQNQMSGQEMNGYRNVIKKHFLSEKAGLTQSCQQLNVVQKRFEAMSLKSQPPKHLEIRKRTRLDQSSGNIFHSLPLVSVYRHRSKHWDAEVTTNHNMAGCTVDYMWYSVGKRETDPTSCQLKSVTQGPLQLLACLGLPHRKEMNQIGILPNKVVSSDHVMLMTKFSLKKSA
ncbi:hypothetical protein CAPTEDRAFT_164382 [Capitella teleta]|uniref:Endonuclease/exonuclease/phosphatase domain-containing protein n=1 Tax=Capitella teleta TaxID=283909 RepID=R7UVG3_CAPTE|nr:hypothetical protein CAPTEDRAFT_164382 [Capitella teleta]|eukprot:ELU10613.1 hypothetical protein CAPTEDRAFT_164382 [Capitella teleta]